MARTGVLRSGFGSRRWSRQDKTLAENQKDVVKCLASVGTIREEEAIQGHSGQRQDVKRASGRSVSECGTGAYACVLKQKQVLVSWLTRVPFLK